MCFVCILLSVEFFSVKIGSDADEYGAESNDTLSDTNHTTVDWTSFVTLKLVGDEYCSMDKRAYDYIGEASVRFQVFLLRIRRLQCHPIILATSPILIPPAVSTTADRPHLTCISADFQISKYSEVITICFIAVLRFNR